MLRKLLFVAFLLVAPAVALSDEVPPEDDPGTETTVMQGGDISKLKENLDPIPFLVGAYAVIWTVLFGYIAVIHRRGNRLQAEITALRADIARATAPR